jgi:hypothetical protein
MLSKINLKWHLKIRNLKFLSPICFKNYILTPINILKIAKWRLNFFKNAKLAVENFQIDLLNFWKLQINPYFWNFKFEPNLYDKSGQKYWQWNLIESLLRSVLTKRFQIEDNCLFNLTPKNSKNTNKVGVFRERLCSIS